MRPQTRGHNSVKSEPIFKIFVTGRFPGTFSVKCSLLKVPVHLAYCCHTFLRNRNVVKQAINDKLQGSVSKYLDCGGVVNNQRKKGLLLNLPVFFKSVNIWQSYKQERGCLVHFLLAVRWPGTHSARDNHVFACNYQTFADFKNVFTVRLSNKPFLNRLLTTPSR